MVCHTHTHLASRADPHAISKFEGAKDTKEKVVGARLGSGGQDTPATSVPSRVSVASREPCTVCCGNEKRGVRRDGVNL